MNGQALPHSSLDMLTITEQEDQYAPMLQLAWARPKKSGVTSTGPKTGGR